jgi:hypothetical protein
MDKHDPHNDPRAQHDAGDPHDFGEPKEHGSHRRRERYEQARSAFDALGLDEKAVFLVEAAARTLTRGIEDGARKLSDELNRAFEDLERAAKHTREKAEHAANEATSEEASGERPEPTVPPKPPHSTSEVQGGGAPATPKPSDDEHADE